jgi:hypothetical protein
VAGPPIDPRLEEAIRLQEEEEQAREKAARGQKIRQSYVNTFTSPDGRVVLQDLRDQFYDVDGYIPGDPAGSHAAAQARNVILRILTILADEAKGPKEAQKDAEV